MDTEIFVTKDGSHSLLNRQLNETYHSVHGALQESLYVFIQNGLAHFIDHKKTNAEVSVYEVGFGTGLNALLSLQFALRVSVPLNYVSIEAFPLLEETWRKLNYTSTVGLKEEFEQLHTCSWAHKHVIHPYFNFIKQNESLHNVTVKKETFDVIFFDAFAPGKQPDMWELPVLAKVISTLKPQGIFVTYCAKGQLKRDLKTLGMQVETLPGPPGKKEMVRAQKINAV